MKQAEIISVIGARPQFVKAAIVSLALRESGISESVIHTGQHYDAAMSDDLIDELGIDNIVENFGVGSGSHASQTALIMNRFDAYLDANPRFRVVMVYGDTNSTLAAALVASKRNLPIVHVEAGLRSYNRAMPEEINRVLVDHLSEILFCSSEVGAQNLRSEGVTSNVRVVGDVMLDAFELFSSRAIERNAAGELLDKIAGEPFALVTIHRPSNTDDQARFHSIVRALEKLEIRCLWPVHPRIGSRFAKIASAANLVACEPFTYLQMLHLLGKCEVVITDSGGLQKEAYWARRRCVTLRNETEWTETVERGWNTLYDPGCRSNLRDVIHQTELQQPWKRLYGDARATKEIARILSEAVGVLTV